MSQPSDITPDAWRETGPFAVCETMAEVFVAMNTVSGVNAVEQLLRDVAPEVSCESLREAAAELKLVGLIDLAALIRRHLRRAKPPALTFEQRWKVADRAMRRAVAE